MKIATWNVNGIRARQASSCSTGSRASSPTSSACRRSRRRPTSCPPAACDLEGYWCYWHGDRRLLGRRRCIVRKARSPERAGVRRIRLSTSSTRIVATPTSAGVRVASVYVPNGGKDFAAKMALPRRRSTAGRRRGRAAARPLVICGDLNVARTDRDLHPKERKPSVDRPASRRARAVRAAARRAASSTSAATLEPGRTTTCSRGGRRGGTCGSATSAGASTTCWPAQALAARATSRGAARDRHQRSRAGRGQL